MAFKRLTRGLICRVGAGVVAALAGLSGAASAQTVQENLSSSTGVTVTVGAEGRMTPSYDGSKSFDFMPLPLFDVRPMGTAPRFHSPRDGFGVSLYESGGFSAGPVVYLQFARRSNKYSALRGLDDVELAYEVGGFADYWAVPWFRTHVELRRGFQGHHGFIFDIAGDYVKPIQPDLTFSAGLRMRVADGAANGRYFNISPVESAASGMPTYHAGGGIRSVGVGTQLIKQWTPQWATHAFVEYDRLVGDAADSPLVQVRGTPNQFTIGAGFAYSFDLPKKD